MSPSRSMTARAPIGQGRRRSGQVSSAVKDISLTASPPRLSPAPTALVFLAAGFAATALVPQKAGAEAAIYACADRGKLTQLSYPLTHMAQRIASRQPVTIVALGSSSTAGAGAAVVARLSPSNRRSASTAENLPAPGTSKPSGARRQDAHGRRRDHQRPLLRQPGAAQGISSAIFCASMTSPAANLPSGRKHHSQTLLPTESSSSTFIILPCRMR